MRSQPFEIVHVVTAPEAAYASFMVHVSESALEYVEDQFPMHAEPWPIALRAFYAEVSRGAVHIGGLPIGLYAMVTPSRPIQLAGGIQGYVGRVAWYGQLPIRHGFGIIFRLGGLQAGDVIQAGGIYEHV
jgi:hypothetical protein